MGRDFYMFGLTCFLRAFKGWSLWEHVERSRTRVSPLKTRGTLAAVRGRCPIATATRSPDRHLRPLSGKSLTSRATRLHALIVSAGGRESDCPQAGARAVVLRQQERGGHLSAQAGPRNQRVEISYRR